MSILQEAYLDNSATTRAWPEVVRVMQEALEIDYGNPSSLHPRGLEAEKLVQRARERLAGVMGCHADEIYFTSGGTEANNWACFGLASIRKNRGRRIISTAMEHPSIRLPLRALGERGFDIVELPVSREGEIDLERFSDALTPDTILVSVMWVNNEVGSVQPLGEISRLVKEHSPHAVFHVDAVQGLGRVEGDLTGVHALSLSGHKLNGPKGSGALCLKRKVRIEPWLLGGEQEGKLRAGTENVPGILGLARAAELTPERSRELGSLRQRLLSGLSRIDGFQLNGPPARRAAPHIINASFTGVARGEVLVRALAEKRVYVSTGSACHSRQPQASHVLEAMGLRGNALTGAVRYSLCAMNTEEEVDHAIAATAQAVEQVRIIPRGRKG